MDQTLMRKLALLLVVLCAAAGASAQTPTMVQFAHCPNSQISSAGTVPLTVVYTCPFPQATLANNFIVVNTTYQIKGSTITSATVSDNNANSYTQDVTLTTANTNDQAIYRRANAGAGITKITLTVVTTGTNFMGDFEMDISEWYNVATSTPLDVAHCNNATNTSITAGSMTIGTANDLVIQNKFSDPTSGNAPTAETSFTVGSQANITWTFNNTDLNDSTAFQSGVFTTTGAFNPTFTQGASQAFSSCAASYKAATSGTAPSATANRIIYMDHSQVRTGSSPTSLQVPLQGGADSLFVISILAGTITTQSTPTSTPTCTAWTKTGNQHVDGNSQNVTTIWYTAGCTGSNAMTVSIPWTGAASDNTYMIYNIVGPNTWSLDADSAGQNGNQASITASLTTCSACFTPGTSTGIMLANFGQDFCTATGVSAPSGATFDSANYTGNAVDGPETVDENNGWMHKFYTSSPGTITLTWNETCGTNAQADWAGRMASFKTAAPAGAANKAPPMMN